MELRDEERRRAKEVFGRPARLLLGAWVLNRGGEPFYQREAVDSLTSIDREAPSAIVQELVRFVDLRLLQRLDLGDRRVWYQPLENPLWDIFRAAGEAFGLLGGRVLDGRTGR